MQTMTMESMTIQLPATVKSYLEDKVARGECATPGEYVQGLIAEDWKKQIEEKLRQAIEDEERGDVVPWDRADMDRRVREHFKKKCEERRP